MERVRALGQYPTPNWVAEAIVDRYFGCLDAKDVVIEPGCGPGAFLNAIPKHIRAIGIEIDSKVAQIAAATTHRQIIVGDFRTVPLDVSPSAIIGNPPFNLEIIDGFLDRAYTLLQEGGRVGFLLPTYAFQTAGRVSAYAERWSISQELIPRNIYPGLRLPLLFALFSKDRRRTLVGFAFYREAVAVQNLPSKYREAMTNGNGPVWERVIALALAHLGGEADLSDIYGEVEGHRPTSTRFWREQIRKVVQISSKFVKVRAGRYALKESLCT